jgi:F-type H+-transporting ATPase subunit epsilon
MALNTILVVNVVTPKGVIAHTEADSVQAPGELGEFEMLPGHIPMLTALRPGVLTIQHLLAASGSGKARARYAVSSGYLRVDPTGAVEILVEQALPAKEIDAEVAKKELVTAETELAKWGDKPMDGDYVNLQQRAGWARARLDTVGAH